MIMETTLQDVYFFSLPHGLLTQVDLDIYERWKRHSWCRARVGYVVRRVAGASRQSHIVYLHREIMKPEPGQEVHHISGDKLDNRRQNLVVIDAVEHQTHHGHVSGPMTGKYKGVFWATRERKWIAQIKHRQRKIYIGSFTTPEEAAIAYDRVAFRLFGEECYLNFGNPNG